jgi:hypothetical protein
VDANNPWSSTDIAKVGDFHPEIPHFQTEYNLGDWFSLAGLMYKSLNDGEWVVDLSPFIYKFAQHENYAPPVIIVALPNTYLNKINQRDRDFLPVHVNDPAISGGGDKFI